MSDEPFWQHFTLPLVESRLSIAARMLDSPDESRVVVFDVDETRSWSEVADAAGVTALTPFGALGALIERRADHRYVWELLGAPRPPVTVDIRPADLYPDVVPNLAALATAGLRIGLGQPT